MKGKILSVFMLAIFSILTGCQSSVSIQSGGFSEVQGNAIGCCGNSVAAQSDRREYNCAFRKASRVAVGETVYWNNHRTGNWGSFCPTRDGHATCGDYCREFSSVTYIEGRAERTYGTACRRPNGTWEYM